MERTVNYAPPSETDEHYAVEIQRIIQAGIDEHPRSAQVQVGPSEIGGCERKLVWKLAYGGDGRDQLGGWAAFKGTVMHAWLDALFKRSNLTLPDGTPRFWSDMKLPGINPNVNGGTLDLYDRLYQTVVDWKVPGDGTMDKARSGNLARGYYVQAQTYGAGLAAQGHPVQWVGLYFLPQCGDNLGKRVFRKWKFDPSVSAVTFAKVDRYQNMIDAGAPVKRILEMAPTLSDFCQSCPVYIGNGDRRAVCPGATATSRSVDRDKNPFAR